MRQIRLFVADMLPLVVQLPPVPEDSVGATGSALLDRSLISFRRDSERQKELCRSLPLSPMVVNQAAALSSFLQGRSEKEPPSLGDPLDSLVYPECMDQVKRSFKATVPHEYGLSAVSYAIRSSVAGPKERLVECPRLDPNFKSSGGVSHRDTPEEEELARMGLRVMSNLDLLLAAAIRGAADEDKKNRALALDTLQASLMATSHAANLFNRIAGNCELRRREAALRCFPVDPPARLQLRSLPLGGSTLFHGKLSRAKEEAKAREKAGLTKISYPSRSSSGSKSKNRDRSQDSSHSSSGRGRSRSEQGANRGQGQQQQ